METKRYWDERAADMAVDAAADQAYNASAAGRLETAQRRHWLVTSSELRDRYTDADRAEALTDLVAARTAVVAPIEAEWTRERTIERRAAFNAAVKAGEITTAGKVDYRKLTALQTRLGYTMDSLKAAVARHDL